MNKDIAFRVPFLILGHIDQSVKLRKELLDCAELTQALQTKRRTARQQQQLLNFSPNALRRQIRQIDATGQRNGCGFNLKLKTCSELRGPQNPQAVFGKSVG